MGGEEGGSEGEKKGFVYISLLAFVLAASVRGCDSLSLKGECVSYTHWMGSFYQGFVCLFWWFLKMGSCD